MSQHAYSRCWLHLIWAARFHSPALTVEARKRLSGYLERYAEEKGIYMKINFVNSDHVHTLIDLPTNMCIEESAKLLKGGSSHWVNEGRVVPWEFHWGRGYGAFSVSQSRVNAVCEYIGNQEQHHRSKGFFPELRNFVKKYGLVWREEEGEQADAVE